MFYGQRWLSKERYFSAYDPFALFHVAWGRYTRKRGCWNLHLSAILPKPSSVLHVIFSPWHPRRGWDYFVHPYHPAETALLYVTHWQPLPVPHAVPALTIPQHMGRTRSTLSYEPRGIANTCKSPASIPLSAPTHHHCVLSIWQM